MTEWEIRANIYCDGRKAGFSDALGDDLDSALESIATNISRREGITLTRYGRKMRDEEAPDAD